MKSQGHKNFRTNYRGRYFNLIVLWYRFQKRKFIILNVISKSRSKNPLSAKGLAFFLIPDISGIKHCSTVFSAGSVKRLHNRQKLLRLSLVEQHMDFLIDGQISSFCPWPSWGQMKISRYYLGYGMPEKYFCFNNIIVGVKTKYSCLL